MRTLPLAALTCFSSMGPSCLQGPHQGAQKSTMTGTLREISTTSAMKLRVSESLISAPAGALPEPLVLGTAWDEIAMSDLSKRDFSPLRWRISQVIATGRDF